MRTLHHRDGHYGWDRDHPPVVTVSPGDTVTLRLADCFGGQLTRTATGDDVADLDLSRANPLTGPVEVEGAQPGDTLAVDVLDVAVGDVGWTTVIPGFGLLADRFPDPHVIVSAIQGSRVQVGDGLATLPARPFLGTVGVAPAAPGTHSVIPPRRVGGNLDCRDVRPGATLLLPVEVPGALLSAGDPHAAQGDGEVCGTAIETRAELHVRFQLRPGEAATQELHDVRFERPGPALPPLARSPYFATTGLCVDGRGAHVENLTVAARNAVRNMMDHLGREYGYTREQAYALCSVAVDLKVSEVVDVPNFVVSAVLPLEIFT